MGHKALEHSTNGHTAKVAQDTLQRLALVVMDRADVLSRISEEQGRLTRRFATPAMKRVNTLAADWMREAGMTVRQDNIGNLIGRYEASQALDSPASTMLLGSHLDTVRDAGKYDGPLGVLVAIACAQWLHDAGRRLPFALEVVAFADEEGLRYHTSYLGSKAYAGRLDQGFLALKDADSISIAEAIRAFGGDPEAVTGDARGREGLLGYSEVHIEQGPVLEALDLPVCVVSAISGQSRISLRITGEAGHAGTVPMLMRHDALCAAAQFIMSVEAQARNQPDLVATVGQVSVAPGASNVIPGGVSLTLDVRHHDDALREHTCELMRRQAVHICAAREVGLEWEVVQSSRSVACSKDLTDLLSRAVEESGYPLYSLPSGAGHDAVAMSEITPIAMLFVRCKGGISHNPAESVTVEDVEVAIKVAARFLELLEQDQAAS